MQLRNNRVPASLGHYRASNRACQDRSKWRMVLAACHELGNDPTPRSWRLGSGGWVTVEVICQLCYNGARRFYRFNGQPGLLWGE